MNVLYYGLGRNQGGIETYLYKIARNINRENFHLFFMDETGGNACFRKELEALGAVFFDITPRRVSFMKNRKDLEMIFAKNQIDILHFNCNSLSYIAPVNFALKHNIKIVLHSRNSQSVLLSRILHKINFFRLNSNNNHDIKQIAVSKVAGEWMFGKKSNFEIFNNGIEIDRFRFSHCDRETKREELNLVGKHVYGNVGAFLEAKNHRFIIDIFKEIASKDENVILLLIGDGPLRKPVEQKVKELQLSNKVFFLGIRSDIPQIMMAMDCLIFPSLYEGFPNVILEAETTGLPIVMSDVITKEVVLLDSCRQLSLEKSAEKWADECIGMIKQMDANGNKWNRAAAADRISEAGFSVRDEVNKIENMYEEIVAV